ncbi:internalin N-terminal domain-containing protein, partial [Listeria innocua]|uniref:internalin N-terminal domain-containing protein n=1 Tax=Listeria innocua TaxID=1642 RepID=UPI001626768D
MRFSRKAREQKQKNWRMWKKGKQWLCGAALFFTIVSSPGMMVLADEVNSDNSTEVTAGEVEIPLPEGSTENEVEEVEEDETSSTEAVAPTQQEENTPNTTENNEAKVDGGKKERPKQGRLITTPTAISDIFPDANLAEVIRVQLGKSSVNDIVTQSDLDGVTYISASSYNIANISGVEHLRNITYVEAGDNQISDLSPLSGLTSITHLMLNDNQISDLSPIATISSLEFLNIERNHVSDLSAMNNDGSITVHGHGQTITLPEIKWSPSLEVPVTIKDQNGNIMQIINSISNEGEFANNVITWTGLDNVDQDVTYSWGNGRFSTIMFSGTTTVRVTPVAVKILVDDDGDSQTTGDQTLFAEEASDDLEYLEDIYNYAKDQLNGTDYGLISMAQDSDGDYVILVSKVGSLKKEDANGTAVGTDVPYAPIYTVTGTGNSAQLVASYGVSVDAPPAGYVYIYEKGTAQEARYTADTSIVIPSTDTNSNGIPQWREDYTVVQYKKAGALNPTLPDGSQVPGGTIVIPDDAIEGDLITLPDTVTGSDGKEYGVDPNVVDTDPNTPGVQITLTDDDQDIPYFDIALSESTSASLSESESIEQSTSESIEQSTSESVEQSTSESIEQSTSESIEQSTSESIEQSTSESVEQSTSESIEQST